MCFNYIILCYNQEINFVNGCFEEPVLTSLFGFFDDTEVPGWSTTDTKIEIHKDNTHYDCVVGNQCGELNAYANAALYQDFAVAPNQEIFYSFKHIGRDDPTSDSIQKAKLKMGIPLEDEQITDLQNPTVGGEADTVAEDSVGKAQVNDVSGSYAVPDGVTELRLAFSSDNDGLITEGNGLDGIIVTTKSVYDNIVNIAESSQNNDNCVDDIFTVSNQLNNIQGDIQDDSTIEYTFNQPIAVESGILSVDGVDYALDNTNMTISGNTVEITNIPEISTGVNAENIEVEMNVKPIEASNPLDLNVESNFEFYSGIEKEVNPSAEMYSVTDNASVEKECNIPTEITKEIVNENGKIDGEVENNEDITYKVTLTNQEQLDAINVAVRDSMLENLPSYITYDGNVSVNPEVGYTGNLSDGTFVLDTVEAGSDVEIEYTVNIGEIPDDVAEVQNIVTDNGEDPSVCDLTDKEDCVGVMIPVDEKFVNTKKINYIAIIGAISIILVVSVYTSKGSKNK